MANPRSPEQMLPELSTLNLDDLDVEELDLRLEMAMAQAEGGWFCGDSCCVDGNCPNLTCCVDLIQPT